MRQQSTQPALTCDPFNGYEALHLGSDELSSSTYPPTTLNAAPNCPPQQCTSYLNYAVPLHNFAPYPVSHPLYSWPIFCWARFRSSQIVLTRVGSASLSFLHQVIVTISLWIPLCSKHYMTSWDILSQTANAAPRSMVNINRTWCQVPQASCNMTNLSMITTSFSNTLP